MKKILVLMFVLLAAAKAAALEPVTALVGASYANKYNPVFDAFLYNGGYLDMYDELQRDKKHAINRAAAGAVSTDVYNGVEISQITKALSFSPAWPDQVDSFVFTLVNDCLWVPCTDQEMDDVWQRIYDAAEVVNTAGKCVIINEMPEAQSLDLVKAASLFDLPYSIPVADYEKYRQKQIAKFSNVPWIRFPSPWRGMDVPDDGIHPGSGYMKKGVDVISKEIGECRK